MILNNNIAIFMQKVLLLENKYKRRQQPSSHEEMNGGKYKIVSFHLWQ